MPDLTERERALLLVASDEPQTIVKLACLAVNKKLAHFYGTHAEVEADNLVNRGLLQCTAKYPNIAAYRLTPEGRAQRSA